MLLMVEVTFSDLRTRRDHRLICEGKFDEDMSEEEITKIYKPLVIDFLGHMNFKINSVGKI